MTTPKRAAHERLRLAIKAVEDALDEAVQAAGPAAFPAMLMGFPVVQVEAGSIMPADTIMLAPLSSYGYKKARIAAAALRNATKAALPATEDFEQVRADLVDRLTTAMLDYVTSSGHGGRTAKNDARTTLAEDIPGAFYSGFADEAGQDGETEDDDEAWVTTKVAEQLVFLDNAFAALKEARVDPDLEDSDVDDRVAHWADMLDGVYSEGKLRGAKNKLLEFDGDDGAESCDTCQDLKGTKHRVKEILDNNWIPAAGNESFDCKGFHCEHYWKDPKTGERYTF